MSDEEFALSVLEAQRGVAVKRRKRSSHGEETKSDPAQKETWWRIRRYQTDADIDRIVRFLLFMAPQQGLATVHGDPAPGLDPNAWHRRLSAESWGPDRTLIDASRFYGVGDLDDAALPPGSALDNAQNLFTAAEYAREELLPPALRHVDLAIGAASSTGFAPGRLSLHFYFVLDRAVPLSVQYRWFKGAQKAGFPLDPKPLLCGQLFLTGRPLFWGVDDPVPRSLWAFTLPGQRQRATSIDWNEYEDQLAVFEANERRAHVVGAAFGWRAVLDQHLGDGEGQLHFFDALTLALGYAARSAESADEIVGEMRARVVAHPDYVRRHGKYDEAWLRAGLKNLRARDAARDASIAARIAAVRARFPRMGFWS